MFIFKLTTEMDLIYILTHMEDKNYKILFNSKDWVIIALLIFNRV